jgi:uncharacterized protein YqgC (DUF456 family)
MDVLLIVLGAICLLVGIVGCVAPVLPGVPLAYLGLLFLHWTDGVQFSWQFLTIWAVIVVVVQVLDYVIPSWGTKKFGGSKYGVWGSTLGLLIGLFMGPVGIVMGPFVGAVLGELLYFNRNSKSIQNDNNMEKKGHLNKALRAGLGSFIGLLAGTILKLICCGMMVFYFIHELL